MRRKKGKLLFSIDLEDVREQLEHGHAYKERVPANTWQYLKFLRARRARGTFFVVGSTARRYPDLIREITSEGHEIACHSDKHVQVDRQTPATFRRDLRQNLDSLYDAGAKDIIGYRAPTFSVTKETRWVYEILAEEGIKYSSSVLPAKNPLYGWPGFGFDAKSIDEVLEIPISLHQFPLPHLPIAGGVYFRAIPFVLTRAAVERLLRHGRVILAYLHPYDIDVEQERYMHPDIGNKRFFHFLMYYNRASTLPKLEQLSRVCKFQTYGEYYRAFRRA